MDEAKKLVVAWWLKKVFLPFIGKRFPDFFTALMNNFSFPRHGETILFLRYVHGLSWKEIGPKVCLEDRQVFSVHQKCIEKIIST